MPYPESLHFCMHLPIALNNEQTNTDKSSVSNLIWGGCCRSSILFGFHHHPELQLDKLRNAACTYQQKEAAGIKIYNVKACAGLLLLNRDTLLNIAKEAAVGPATSMNDEEVKFITAYSYSSVALCNVGQSSIAKNVWVSSWSLATQLHSGW